MNNATGNTNSRPPLVGLIIVLLVVIAAVVAYQLGWIASSGPTKYSPSTADQVNTKTVLPVNAQRIHFVDSIEQTRRYTGIVRARRSSELAFELTGKIKEVLVDEGQTIQAGQVVATMDTATLQACLLYTSPSPRDQRGSRMPSSA